MRENNANTIIRAVQITGVGLRNGAYANKNVRFDEITGQYTIDTYVMCEIPLEDLVFNRSDMCIRTAVLEGTYPVKPGEWIITNPKELDCDCESNYTISNEMFEKTYEPTLEPGVYRVKTTNE